MRSTGVVETPSGLRPGDHVCWVYDEPARFTAPLLAFLAEGLAAGERVSYVAGGERARAVELLQGLGDVEDLLARGVLTVESTSGAYQWGPSAATERVAAYAEAAHAAVADGLSGLRVVADVTDLVVDPERHRSFCRYEHLIESRLPALPFTAMCAYDGSVLGDAATDLACLHPITNVDVPFRVRTGDDGTIRLSGEIDVSCVDRFAAVAALAVRPDGTTRIDGTDLAFIDHHGLLALDRLAGGGTIEIATRFAGAARVVQLLGLRRVVVRVVGR